MRALVLRLDAPLMSFGGVMIDQHGVIERFPGHAMLTGLIGNALGWCHSHTDRLQSLEERLRLAARWDVAPSRGIDYHTVDLGQPKMREDGWTTRGVPEHRKGGNDARYGTHQRFRHYWADGLMTLVLSLEASGDPSLDDVAHALRHPARPLFLGRKTCLPARPLLDPSDPIREGQSLYSILRAVPVWRRDGSVALAPAPLEACWPGGEHDSGPGEQRSVADRRDWRSNLPSGSSDRIEGLLAEGST